MKLFLALAGVFGFLGVAIGAFGAHGLKNYFDSVDARFANAFHTGTQYHMYHALALLGVAVLIRLFPSGNLFTYAGWCFTAGIILFSGSLYALSLTQVTKLGAVTPIGGLCFLAGWLLLFFQAYKLAE